MGWGDERGCCVLLLLMSLLSVFETDTNDTERSPVANLSQVHRSLLCPVDLASAQASSLTKVLLLGLKPDTNYTAKVYSRAADGTEGQPGKEVFTTSRLDLQNGFSLSLICSSLYLNCFS